MTEMQTTVCWVLISIAVAILMTTNVFLLFTKRQRKKLLELDRKKIQTVIDYHDKLQKWHRELRQRIAC